ncbi:hypothetical protein EJ08DRAFT_700920 [Tothia fuscella]|uniref:Anaphase-promoting complex subunit 4 n=1 Tax=Tothia fuscella TaxID=1048955 RepID=A0A9P4NJN5_9PEZI|nr:hypothetical protein EJ08DRAFT_700920 [Tothia fuscella]
MDLVAVVDQNEQVNVYRFGGQRAFGLHRNIPGCGVVCLCWKFNGQYLAVGWTDGIVQVLSAETGNVLQNFNDVTTSSKRRPKDEDGEATRSITCIGWGLNFIDAEAVKTKTGVSTSKPKRSLQSMLDKLTTDTWDDNETSVATLDDFLERIPDPEKVEIPVDLATQLARIDVTSLLPRLPVLPSLPPTAGQQAVPELFTNQASLDNALHTATDRDLNGLDTLLLCHEDGGVHLILYDSLSLGDVEPPKDWAIGKFKHLQHTSHPFACSHMLLTEIPPANPHQQAKIALIPLSLRFLYSAGSHLHMIESRTAQLETLVRYVSECIRTLHLWWKIDNVVPDKFKGIVNEMLEEKEEPTLVQSMFHLAVTGNCPPTLKEWLVDMLQERGRQRWDERLTEAYSKIIAIAFQSLLPALDRCSIILSNLQGLAQYHEHSPVFNVPVESFTQILQIIRCMRLLTHQLLIHANREFRQFGIFMKWLKHEIDVQATDPNSASAEETAEKDPGVDYAQLLAYVQGPLEESKVDAFLKWGYDVATVGMDGEVAVYDDVKKAVDRFSMGESGSKVELLDLQGHFEGWLNSNKVLVERITSHQRGSSFMNCGIVVEEGEVVARDVRMVFEGLGGKDGVRAKDMTTYCAFVKKGIDNEVHLHRIIHSDVFDSYQAIRSMEAAVLHFDNNISILDTKFIDDSHIMLLAKSSTDLTSHLLILPYRPSPDCDISYTASSTPHSNTYLPKGHAISYSSSIIVSDEMFSSFVQHTFSEEDRFKPLKIEVNGRKERRFVTVVAEDLRYLRVFDLDFREDKFGEALGGEVDEAMGG